MVVKKSLILLLAVMFCSANSFAQMVPERMTACNASSECTVIEPGCGQVAGINGSFMQEYEKYKTTANYKCKQKLVPDHKEYFWGECDKGICKASPTKSNRKSEVPKEVLKSCLDDRGRIADAHEKYNPSDAIEVGDKTPRAILYMACKDSDNSWYVDCEKGGFAPIRRQYSVKLNNQGMWLTSETNETRKHCEGIK